MRPFCVVFWSLVAATTTAPSQGRELNGFDLQGALVPEREILPGGPPRDGIPAIDEPRFIPGSKALEVYGTDARAIVVRRSGAVKAYPVAILNWHEVVNDEVSGRAIAVTYCPLCGTGVVFHARAGDRRLHFGVSGLLYQSDVLLYDRETKSLWSQLLRKALAGEYKGTRLDVLPSRLERLGAVVEKEPDVQVLSTDTGHRRDYKRDPYSGYERSQELFFPVNHRDEKAPLKAWSLLVESGEHRLIVPLDFLDREGRTTTVTVGGRQVTIEYDRKAREIHCADAPEGVTCLSGYYFALRTFYPEARLYRPPSPAADESRSSPGG